MRWTLFFALSFALAVLLASAAGAPAQNETKKQPEKKKKEKGPPPSWVEPKLPDGKTVVTDSSPKMLKAPSGVLREGVVVAKTPPTIDFVYYPGQTYRAKIWSNWGDGLAANGKYCSAIGDHDAPEGNAFVFEYDPVTKIIRLLVDLRDLLKLMMGWYTPGKVHSRIDMGADGKLYFSTHRGSTTTTTETFHYKGDWIVAVDPKTAKPEIVAHGPVPKHCLPCSVLDPDRMIFYAGTAPGTKEDGGVRFLAYDVKNRKVLYDGVDGPPRYMIFARSTGKVYFCPSKGEGGSNMVCFDPAKASPPYPIKATLGLRAATEETKNGFVYTLGLSLKEKGAAIIAFNTKTETAEELGLAAVGAVDYVASIDV
jgi:hypothetical protein